MKKLILAIMTLSTSAGSFATEQVKNYSELQKSKACGTINIDWTPITERNSYNNDTENYAQIFSDLDNNGTSSASVLMNQDAFLLNDSFILPPVDTAMGSYQEMPGISQTEVDPANKPMPHKNFLAEINNGKFNLRKVNLAPQPTILPAEQVLKKKLEEAIAKKSGNATGLKQPISVRVTQKQIENNSSSIINKSAIWE